MTFAQYGVAREIRMLPRDKKPVDRRAILDNHFLLSALTEPDREALLTYSRVEHYRAGETIFLKGSPGRGMMAVLRGEVRISAPSPDGREIVLNLIRPGEVFGEIALLDGKERSADAVALADCELLIIEHRDFLPFIESRPRLALRMLAILCERLRRTTRQVEELLFLNLPPRLARQILALAATNGMRVPGGWRIDKKISQRELGQRVGSSRESVNKQLVQWQQSGILKIEGGIITILDEAALRRLVDGGW
jgi:CRP/FNR family transcriptional regulator, cyclic AMP receptor protein